MEVIPAINAPNRVAAEQQLAVISAFLPEGRWVHLDVADGVFTQHTTWRNTTEIASLITPTSRFRFEVHLMVADLKSIFTSWLDTSASRIVMHLEAINELGFESLLEQCAERGLENALAISPATEIVKLDPHIKLFKRFHLLAVSPGRAGQQFDSSTPERVRQLRKKTDAVIAVDGGITPATARQCRDAGADSVVVASYLFRSQDPAAALQEFMRI
jgi:ribulose-phosphate 3-epimerase